MPDTEASRAIRDALTRSTLAAGRHRAAVGRVLRLSDNEVLAIVHLRRAGELTPTALGRLLSLTSGGTTALVQRLERSGHVARERHPEDGRSRLLRLTADGRRSADEVLRPFEEALDGAVAALPARQREAVAGFLADVARLAEEHADRAAVTAVQQDSIRIDEPVPALSL